MKAAFIPALVAPGTRPFGLVRRPVDSGPRACLGRGSRAATSPIPA